MSVSSGDIMNRFYVDAETDGLYGSFLSVAALVTDEDGNEMERFYMSVDADIKALSTPWLTTNILPHLSNAYERCDSEKALLDAFWEFWLKHRENAICIAYVQYPVEARLFSRCVEKDRNARAFLAPFPLYDLSTLLLARGYPFDADLPSLVNDEPLTEHDAMDDVLMMAKAWKKLS